MRHTYMRFLAYNNSNRNNSLQNVVQQIAYVSEPHLRYLVLLHTHVGQGHFYSDPRKMGSRGYKNFNAPLAGSVCKSMLGQ